VKSLTLDGWEKKYVVEPVERFDQKNEMFSRPFWDPELRDLKRKALGLVMPRDRAGYKLPEVALADAAWYLEHGFAQGVIVGQTGLYSWDSLSAAINKMPDGLKIEVTDPEKLTKDVKKVAMYFGADLVGVCRLDKRWLYSNSFNFFTRESKPVVVPEEYEYVIAMAHEMDYDLVGYAPTDIGDAGTGMGYTKMAFTAGLMAKFIRDLGYKAIPCGNDTALSVPIAMQAGLGELARNGLLITSEYGPRIRLSKVFTNLPLVVDQPIEFGITDFCSRCLKCADSCPSRAIINGERTTKPHNISNVSGELKWPVDGEKCLKFWGANGCSCLVCIRVCPFNKHMNWFHRLVGWVAAHIPRVAPLLVKADNWLGYGKQADAEYFWEKWQPRSGLRITRS
jgi:reductive dehalogenase